MLTLTLFGSQMVMGIGSKEDVRKQYVCDSTDSSYNELPACVRTFDYINKYAALYNVPLNIAFGIIHYESGYNGIYQLDYNPAVTSNHKAYGACQMKVGTANLISDSKVTKRDLLDNLELNIALGMKLLSTLKGQYGSWKVALGAYNTGKPVVNKYAVRIAKFDVNKMYKKWTPNKG